MSPKGGPAKPFAGPHGEEVVKETIALVHKKPLHGDYLFSSCMAQYSALLASDIGFRCSHPYTVDVLQDAGESPTWLGTCTTLLGPGCQATIAICF